MDILAWLNRKINPPKPGRRADDYADACGPSWRCTECDRLFIGKPFLFFDQRLCPKCNDMLPEALARKAGLVLLLALVLGSSACAKALPSEPLAGTPTPTTTFAGSIGCSNDGGRTASPCPCANCVLPPGWTVVCLDTKGAVMVCPS